MYAKIGDSNVRMYYKEVATKDTKTNEQLISDLTAKKKRNNELADEKTAEGLKELLRTEQLPQSAFTADEETAMYFFMLSKLRRHNYKAVGLKENDYYGYLTDEKKLKIASSLTEEQKTIVRRDYLYSHLTDGTRTVGDEKGGMLLAFSKQHLPEKTEEIVATYKEDYGKKNARLDERIAGLKKAEKKAKADAKAKKAEQTAKTEKTPKTAEKTIKKGTNATAPKSETAKTKGKEQPKATQSEKKEAKPTPKADKVLIVGIPKAQPKAEAVAV